MENGTPGLIGAVARLGCRVAAWENVGTHCVIFGAVEEIDTPGARLPLIYANRSYARLAPPADEDNNLRCA